MKTVLFLMRILYENGCKWFNFLRLSYLIIKETRKNMGWTYSFILEKFHFQISNKTNKENLNH